MNLLYHILVQHKAALGAKTVRRFKDIIAARAFLKCDLALTFGFETVSLEDLIVYLIISEISIYLEHLHTALGPAGPMFHFLFIQAVQYPACNCLMPERMGIDPFLDPGIPGNVLDSNTDGFATQWVVRLIYCGPQGAPQGRSAWNGPKAIDSSNRYSRLWVCPWMPWSSYFNLE